MTSIPLTSSEAGDDFRLLVEKCFACILVQRGGVIAYSNGAALDCLGFSRAEDLVGRPVHELFEPVAYATLSSNFVKLGPLDEQLFIGDLRLRRRSGEPFDAEVYHVGVRFKGHDATMCSFRDVTAVRRMELDVRQAQKLESVVRMAGGLAHEINTPMQYIGDNAAFLGQSLQKLIALLQSSRVEIRRLALASGDAGAIERAAADEKRARLDYVTNQVPQAIRAIIDGAAKVSHIVQTMKCFARADGESEGPLEINRLLEDTLVVTAHELTVAEVRTNFGALPQSRGHRGDLNQAFFHLLLNAAHAVAARHEASGPGVVELSTRCQDGNIEIRIADNGCGIPKEIQERIFDPFFTTKEVGSGAGQGLAVARAAVQKHGGTIDFESTVGQGTAFVVRIPVTDHS